MDLHDLKIAPQKIAPEQISPCFRISVLARVKVGGNLPGRQRQSTCPF